MKRTSTIVKDINKIFPASFEAYPVCFKRDDRIIISTETTYKARLDGCDEDFDLAVADYYGEYRGGYPWIDPKLEKYCEDNDLFVEWENVGGLSIWPN
jgi:hypothetical protein